MELWRVGLGDHHYTALEAKGATAAVRQWCEVQGTGGFVQARLSEGQGPWKRYWAEEGKKGWRVRLMKTEEVLAYLESEWVETQETNAALIDARDMLVMMLRGLYQESNLVVPEIERILTLDDLRREGHLDEMKRRGLLP